MSLWPRKIKRKDGTVREVWYASVERPTGRRYKNGKPIYKRETFSLELDAKKVSRRKAQEAFDRKRSEILNRAPQPISEDPTLAVFTPRYVSYCRDVIGKRSWDRDVQSLKFLNEFFGSSRLSEITPGDCIDYQRKRKNEGRSNRTVNLELTCLRHLYNVARLKGDYSGDNPVRRVQFLEVINTSDRVLSPEEEKRLMAASPAFLRDVLTCALQTGMRKAEILSLTWENVDLKNSYILIESARAKAKRIRKVPISGTLRNLLVRIRKENDQSHVFLNHRGRPYKIASAIQGVFEAARKKAGIEDFRFHDLRHTVATRLVEAGADIFRVAKILGHQDVRMTQQRYAHPDQSLKDAIELLSGDVRNNNRNSRKKASRG